MKVMSEFSEYADALRNREIRIKKCDSCGWESITPRVYCPKCHSESWSVRHQKPVGTVYTQTTIEVIGNPEISDPPLEVAIVELSGGARLLGQINESEGCDIGDEVRLIDIEDIDGKSVPVFGESK